MTRRAHPARRARTLTGASSVAAVVGITGFLALHHLETTAPTTTPKAQATSYDGDSDTDDVASTTSITSTTVAAAQPATPSTVATTQSAGS